MTLAFVALLAGFVHVLSGPDHLAAIAPYAVDRKSGAWRVGFRWGLGHTAGVLGVGLVALLLRHKFSVGTASTWGERCVGIMLLGIGIRGVSVALARRFEQEERGEIPELRAGPEIANDRDLPAFHGHGNDRRRGVASAHVHGRAAFGVGTLHGLAGSSHLLGIVPALAIPSDSTAVTYLLLFGVGSVAAMAIFAALVGWIATRRMASSVSAQAVLLGVCSLLAIAVGCYWIFSDLWFIPRAGSVG